jgi:hypothetical protein
MITNITKKLAGTVALLTGGSRAIGAAIVAADGANVVSVFVTNGGYNGVQQVLKLSIPLSPRLRRIKLRRTPDSER